MAEDLKDILSHLSTNTSQETLLQYINEKLGTEESHALEKNMLNDVFENDAVEGLQSLADKKRIELIVDKLNRDLKKKTTQKIKQREKRNLKPEWWLYLSILILLIILVLIYTYLHNLL